MDNSYKRMFVLNEDEYREFKRYKSASHPPATETVTSSGVKCPICGREYPNENILAHHLKSHFNGFKCNICGKEFKFKRNLTVHLRKHAPQVQPSQHSVLDNNMPNQPTAVHLQPTAAPLQLTAAPTAVHLQPTAAHLQPTAAHLKTTAAPLQLTAAHLKTTAVPKKQSAVPKKKHKRKSILNFEVKQWLTL
jgi:transposase-like protein